MPSLHCTGEGCNVDFSRARPEDLGKKAKIAIGKAWKSVLDAFLNNFLSAKQRKEREGMLERLDAQSHGAGGTRD